MLVMERRFRRFVIRGSDDWAERVKMGDLMREEIRESIRWVTGNVSLGSLARF